MSVVGVIAFILACWIFGGCAAPTASTYQPEVEAAQDPRIGTAYTIALPRPQTQMVDISIRVEDVSEESIDFVLPAWRPGRYVILDPAGGVRDVRATGADGQPLPVHKLDKTTWRIQTAGVDTATLSYTVYANSLGDRTRHVDDTHAFISPASVLMYVPARRSGPVTVAIEAPEGWQTATGLEPAPGRPQLFIAPDYDTLVDSPLEIGVHESIDFDVDGTPHQIVVWGRGNFVPDTLSADFTKIIRAQRDIFGDLPYGRYVFIVHCTPTARGGTEHLNSTVVQTSTGAFDTPKSYRGFLGLIAHEFFHTWNVKQLRPAELKPYDYVHENYTTSLWIAEGMTSYFDSLSLVRAGLLEADEYLKQRAEAIGSLLETPGRTVQSLEESSFDAWIKFNRSTPDSVNSTVSFYGKGSLVSLLLDLELRRRTDDRVPLDAVMRQMYRAYPLAGPGYTPEDFRAMVEQMSDSDFGEFFADFVAGTAELPLADAFSTVGLALTFEPDKDAAKDGKPDPAAYIGLDLTDRNGIATVDAARSDGPAYAAGVIAGDEIVAINGVRLRAADLAAQLDLLQPGDAVRLAFFRRDDLREVEFKAGAKPRGKWKLKRIDEAAAAQKAAYESWLKQPWPTEPAEEPDENP